jgi:hypothetical protein
MDRQSSLDGRWRLTPRATWLRTGPRSTAKGARRGLLAIDPSGPDNAYAPAQVGEGGLTVAAMKR